ncbi:gas vesicle protein K [Thermocrispum agreste]|uniref:gas vesicle protein K n=1 Tax=Thermocrispum agreste TaxID=37925 RepID=UPI0003F56FAB|nr:gas vesicle protein K [Thermocrispum agreste]
MTAPRGRKPLRLDADPDDVGRGLGGLVVAVLDLVRQLLERQALRRVDASGLSADEVERLGQALLALEERFEELRETFGVGSGPTLPFDAAELLAEMERKP